MTADEIQAQIDTLRADLATAESTYIIPLRTQLNDLYEQLYSQQDQCTHENVTQIDDGSTSTVIKYQCDNTNCKKVFSIPMGG